MELVAKPGLENQMLCSVLMGFALRRVLLVSAETTNSFLSTEDFKTELQSLTRTLTAPGIRRYLNYCCFTFRLNSFRKPLIQGLKHFTAGKGKHYNKFKWKNHFLTWLLQNIYLSPALQKQKEYRRRSLESSNLLCFGHSLRTAISFFFNIFWLIALPLEGEL